MAGAIGRRRVLACLAGTGLAALGSWTGPRLRAADTLPARFDPPPGPMLFSRELVRKLADGNSVTVTRRWRIGFARQGRGWAVAGEAAGAEVAAPAALAGFARIERERAEPGPFPLLLGPDGTIATEGASADPTALDQALALARARIAAAPIDPAGRAGSAQFFEALASAAGETLTPMPVDLFFPAPLERREERVIGLPDGNQGRIELVFVAQLAQGGSILREARRSIATIIGDQRRELSESWTLLPVR